MVYLWLDFGFTGFHEKGVLSGIKWMDFMIWAARTMHMFSVVLWLGGLLYQTAVLLPSLGAESNERILEVLGQLKSFLPFIWMSLTTLFVTGICLMLFSPRFLIFEYADWWSLALGIKQALFLVITVVSFGFTRMLTRAISSSETSGWSLQGTRYRDRVVQLSRMNVFLGVGALLLSASMR